MVPLDELQDLPRHPARRRYLVWAGIAVLGAVALFFLLQPAEDADGPQGPQRLSSFELPLLVGGGTLSTEDLEGDPVVVNFFASWCGPCREEAPLFENTYKEYRRRGVQFVGIATQDTEEDARAFVKEFGITYPIVEDFDHTVFDDMDLIGLPQTLFVSADLSIKESSEAGDEPGTSEGRPPTLGAIEADQLRAGIESLLETD